MGRLARIVTDLKNPRKSEVGTKTKKQAYEIRTVNDIPYFQGLLKQLEEKAHSPVVVSNDSAKMIEQVGRQNSYRELLSVLRKDLETAERMIAEDQARQRIS